MIHFSFPHRLLREEREIYHEFNVDRFVQQQNSRDFSGLNKESTDRQNRLASLSSSPRMFGERVGQNINSRRENAAGVARNFPAQETFEETTEIVNMSESMERDRPILALSPEILAQIDQLPKALGVLILRDFHELQKQRNPVGQLQGFVKDYIVNGIKYTVELHGQIFQSGYTGSAIAKPPNGSERTQTPEAQKMNAEVQTQKEETLKSREQAKYAEAKDDCWKMLENGVTDQTGEPYLYKRHTIEEKKGDQVFKKQYLFAYSKDGGMEMMDPETGVWRKPTEEEASKLKDEMDNIQDSYESTVKEEMKKNPDMAKGMEENKVFEMFLRSGKNQSKETLGEILNHPQWTGKNRNALDGMKGLPKGKKEESLQSKIDQAIEKSLPQKKNNAEKKIQAPLSPEYTEKLQQLQKAIDALPLNTRDSLLASIRKNPERWKQGSIEDQLKVVELIRKSNTLLASLFNPTPFTDPEKTEIIQNLQSLNPEEFEAIEMLLDSKSVKEMIDRLQVDYPSVTLVLNADLQKLIEEEVKRRKSPPEKENKIGLGEIYDRYITELKKDFPTLGLVHQGGHFDRIQATDKSKNKTISFYLQKDGMVFIGNDPIQVSDAEGQIPPGPKAGSQAFKADSIEGYKKAIKEYVYEGKSPTEKQPSPPPEEKSESQEVSDTIKKKVLDRLKITDQVVKEIGMKVFCEKKGDLTEYYLTNNQTPFVLGYVYIDNNNKITKSSLRDDLLEAALDLKQFKDGINLLASGKKIENIVMRGVVEKFLSFYLQKSIKFNDDSLQISVKKNGDNLLIKAENNIVGHNDYREIRYDIATGTMQDYYDSETEK